MANDKKMLSVPETLHELHKGLKERITQFESQCVALRKAELAKDEMDGDGPDSMAMAESKAAEKMELCKGCGYEHGPGKHFEHDLDKKLDGYAKGEMPAGSDPDAPGPTHEPIKKPKVVEAEHSKEAGSDGVNVKPMKKAALPGATPTAPKPPGAGATMPKPPKLPGMGGGMPKPAAPAKTPALGAGQPALKTEMKKVALQPGATLPMTAPAPQLAGVGKPTAKPAVGVQTMAERVASRMPAGQPHNALTPPPISAKPGLALPGAHLFSKKPRVLGKSAVKENKSECPVCNDKVSSLDSHLHDHPEEIEQRLKNPKDSAIEAIKSRGLNPKDYIPGAPKSRAAARPKV